MPELTVPRLAEAIHRLALFATIDPQILAAMIGQGKVQKLAAGHVICRTDEEAGGFYVLFEGEVRFEVDGTVVATGHGNALQTDVGGCSLFGAMPFFKLGTQTRTADVIVATPDTVVLLVPYVWLGLFMNVPAFSHQMATLLTAHLEVANEHCVQLSRAARA